MYLLKWLYHYPMSTNERFLQEFLFIMKRSLHNCLIILRNVSSLMVVLGESRKNGGIYVILKKIVSKRIWISQLHQITWTVTNNFSSYFSFILATWCWFYYVTSHVYHNSALFQSYTVVESWNSNRHIVYNGCSNVRWL